MTAESDNKPGPSEHPDHDRFERNLNDQKIWLERVDASIENYLISMRHQLLRCPILAPSDQKLLEIKKWLESSLAEVEAIRNKLVKPQTERMQNEMDLLEVQLRPDVSGEDVNPEDPLPPELDPTSKPPNPPPKPPKNNGK